MQKKKSIFLGLFISLGLLIIVSGMTQAEDVDVFRTAVKNNAMMVVDTSGSMSWPIYNENVDYANFMKWMIEQGLAEDEGDGRDGQAFWDKDSAVGSNHDYDRLDPDGIYLVSTFVKHEVINYTDSEGNAKSVSVIDDVMWNEGSETDARFNKRYPFLVNAIIPVKSSSGSAWTLSDTSTIETTTVDGEQHVVFPTGATVDISGSTVITPNSLKGVTLPNHQDILLTHEVTDPRTGVITDVGFVGFLRSTGFYFSGVFEKSGEDLRFTDNKSNAQTGFDGVRVYVFATGNWLNFLKLVEDFKVTSSYRSCASSLPRTYTTQRYMAWRSICDKSAVTQTEVDVWTEVNIMWIYNEEHFTQLEYSRPRNETRGTINLSAYGDVKSLQVYFSTLAVENRSVPGCSCTNDNSNNDGVFLEDQKGSVLKMVSNPDSGIYETLDGKLYGCNASGWTGTYNVGGVSTIAVKFSVAPGAHNCNGSHRGFLISKIRYSTVAPSETVVSGEPEFECCNGQDGLGFKIKSRMDVAKNAMKYVIRETKDTLNWGLTRFNGSDGGTVLASVGTDPDDIITLIDSLHPDGETPLGETIQDAYNSDYSYLKTHTSTTECAYNYIVAMTDGFPTGDDSWNRINDSTAPNYPNPTFGRCTLEDYNPSVCGSTYGDGDNWPDSNYTDDVAHWLYNEATYRHTVHAIAFGLNNPMLGDVAESSAGEYVTAYNEQQVISAFYTLGLVMSASVSFVAPVVSVDQANRTQSGDRLYMAFFKPVEGERWKGNLKKYGLSWMVRTDCGRIDSEFIVVDKNGDPAGECDGSFKSTSISYWSSVADGGEVTKGGTGALMKDAMPGDHAVHVPSSGPYYDFRNIFTYKNGSLVRFYRDGDSGVSDTITAEDLGVSSVTDYPVPNLERDKIINLVYGYTYDAVDNGDMSYDEDTEGDPVAKRSWILGAIIHAEPCIVDYLDVNNDLEHRLIAIGANDGMLHIFTDQDITLGTQTYPAGSEIWAFIPGDLLPRLKELRDSTTHPYFVDGFCTLHRPRSRTPGSYYQKTLVFGERRGGRSYWALDVSNPDPSQWTVKWHVEGGVFSDELGESWSKPTFAEIRTGSMVTDFADVVVFGGGYDTEEDNFPEPWLDDDFDGKYEPGDGETYTDENNNTSYDHYNPDMNETGRGIFVLNLSDGSLRFSATYGATDSLSSTTQQYAAMKWCFPADPTVVDLTTSLWIYMADVYGQIWKVTYVYSRTPEEWMVRRIFQANPGSDQENMVPPIDTSPSLDGTDYGRKTFYSPEVSLLGNDWTDFPVLYFGTGDRAHPRVVPNYHDRFYVVSDTAILADETALLNLTCSELDENADVDQNGEVNINDDTAKKALRDILYGDTTYSGGIARGWYRIMGKQGDCTQDSVDHEGEKVLSRPSLFFGNVFFTSYQPIFGDPCKPNGNAFIYALDFSEGTAALDLNLATRTPDALADTYRIIENTGIASRVRVIMREGHAAGLVSAGESVAGAGEEESPGTGHYSTIPGPPGGVSKILWETY